MKKIVVLLLVFVSYGSVSFAQEQHDKHPHESMKPLSKEDREKMAQAHEKMATCLRTDKGMKECHDEMNAFCKETMGKDRCHMMGHKGKRKHH